MYRFLINPVVATVTHGDNLYCPGVQSGEWRWCKGHPETVNHRLVVYDSEEKPARPRTIGMFETEGAADFVLGLMLQLSAQRREALWLMLK